jgi:hypothetical protein
MTSNIKKRQGDACGLVVNLEVDSEPDAKAGTIAGLDSLGRATPIDAPSYPPTRMIGQTRAWNSVGVQTPSRATCDSSTVASGSSTGRTAERTAMAAP